MLVLTRRVGEKIMVGDCTVTVISWTDENVRLGFEAPKSVSIDREEIWKRKQSEKGS